MVSLKKVSCVSIALSSIEILKGNPEVCANIAPIVHVAPGIAYPPFNFLLFPEKSSLACANSVSSGITFFLNAPPFSLSEYVASIDSKKIYIKFLFCSGNETFVVDGSA